MGNVEQLLLSRTITCIEKIKGTFFTGYIDTEDFNPDSIKLHAETLGDMSVVYSIGYEGKELLNKEMIDYISTDFIVYLDK